MRLLVTDQPQQAPSLAERALARLRRLADGNGVDPDQLTPIDVLEKTIVLNAKLEAIPSCETAAVSYPGSPRSKDPHIARTAEELQSLVEKHKKEFRENPSWLELVKNEIRADESLGWGLEAAKVSLPEKSGTYAFSQTCLSCNGQGFLTCETCLGKGVVPCPQCGAQLNGAFHGHELCYYCMGRAEDPQNPGSPCPICKGSRYAPCRTCQMRAYVPCPACNGKRGVSCGSCTGKGIITEEIAITCGADTAFSMSFEGHPTGIRRGLERIGLRNFLMGHADVSTAEIPADKSPTGGGEADPAKSKFPLFAYKATFPYAEFKIDLGGKKGAVSALGKRCALSGVPFFLDYTLRPWREKLGQAAEGTAPLEEALEARAIKDVLGLVLSNKGTERDIRRLYPFGLSSEVTHELLKNVVLALKKVTEKSRATAAVASVFLMSLFFYFYFVEGFQFLLTHNLRPVSSFGVDLFVLLAACLAGWGALTLAAYTSLRQHFPAMRYSPRQKIGKIGISMLAGIFIAFVLFIYLAPVKPFWLAHLLLRI